MAYLCLIIIYPPFFLFYFIYLSWRDREKGGTLSVTSSQPTPTACNRASVDDVATVVGNCLANLAGWSLALVAIQSNHDGHLVGVLQRCGVRTAVLLFAQLLILSFQRYLKITYLSFSSSVQSFHLVVNPPFHWFLAILSVLSALSFYSCYQSLQPPSFCYV